MFVAVNSYQSVLGEFYLVLLPHQAHKSKFCKALGNNSINNSINNMPYKSYITARQKEEDEDEEEEEEKRRRKEEIYQLICDMKAFWKKMVDGVFV